jgi:hypothetical protein
VGNNSTAIISPIIAVLVNKIPYYKNKASETKAEGFVVSNIAFIEIFPKYETFIEYIKNY